VHELFGDRVESLSLSRSKYVESAASSVAYTELFGETFGAPGGPAEYAYEYLLVVARKGAGHEPD
jgi:hypothetical protein